MAYIGYENLVDADATVVRASSSELLLPVSNLLIPHVARKWRGIAGSTDYVIVDFGSATLIDTVGVFGITGNHIRVRLSSVDTTGAAGDVYDSASQPVDSAYASHIEIIPVALSGRYLRVDIVATGDYVEIGRIFAGVRHEFTYNFSWNWQRQWVDRSTRTKTRGGQTQIFADTTYRCVDVTFDFLTQADRDGFIETIDRVNAQKIDVLFVSDPDSTNLARDSLWGLMTTITPVVQSNHDIFAKQFQIEQRL